MTHPHQLPELDGSLLADKRILGGRARFRFQRFQGRISRLSGTTRPNLQAFVAAVGFGSRPSTPFLTTLT